MSRDARLALGPVPSSAARARTFVDVTLRGWGCTGVADLARLLTSELVTNGLLHARSDLEVVLRRRPGGIRVEVHDASTVEPVLRRYEGHSMTGRGLGLVEDLATRWGVENRSDGKAVWFELDG